MSIIGSIFIIAGIAGCVIYFPDVNIVTPRLFLSAAAAILGALMVIADNVSAIKKKLVGKPEVTSVEPEGKTSEE